MMIAIHQPNYVPWLGYFYKIYIADKFVFLDDVPYSKNSYFNRSKILQNNKDVWLTVPVKVKLGMKINEIHSFNNSWKESHLSKIRNAYSESTYFHENWKPIKNLYLSLFEENLYLSNIKYDGVKI